MIKQELRYNVQSQNKSLTNISTHNIVLSIHHSNKSMYNIHKVLINQLHQKRQLNAHTKTRSEVRGGGKKPWKQKGTGKARAGSIRSPLWKGGGVIFGPRHKIVNNKINKKEKKLAINTLIYNKFSQTTAIDRLINNEKKPNTKLLLDQLTTFNLNIAESKLLIIIDKQDRKLYLSARNLKNVEIILAKNINILALLKSDKILVTRNALSIIEQTYNE
uniref:Large ribosomal subunit protein uL4c n=1 Tax=Nitophyllum punctatum TaxID=158729 RepID=A0A4D6WW25_9FLOR|nr:ribosomal protein L4 [Nitophyllum punctatum]